MRTVIDRKSLMVSSVALLLLPALAQAGETLVGTKPSLAKLTLARIIAATVLRMWKDEEEYRPERDRRAMESDRSA